ncbi:hypothetical protein OJ963_41615 [Streptomyces sp. RS2]|uniref:hypothetical protein n=1 Tax=Streptomyces sp. RS2 TaxID=1451205 RepID=UPI0021F85EDA|nr:hypothetical protein [Streptomyces sp. RS2]MCW1100263.1 hypothetical protein [Streptomyces sp. RS2]
MGYLRGFVPWIISGVVSSFDWRWGAAGGLASALLLLLQDRRRGVGVDALVLEISSVLYFIVIGVLAFTNPDSGVSGYTDTLSFMWLAATAWGSLVGRRPFTLGIAKRQTPREYWGTPQFIQVNNHITGAWGGGFTFIAVVLAVCHLTNASGWVGVVAHVVGLLVPAVFTKRYPARVQARMLHAPSTAASR